MERFADRVAVITGAGSGIGAASARRLASERAAVVVCDIDPARADEVAKAIVSDGGRATSVAGDVSKRADVESMVQAAVDTYGRLDVMHNNAGIGGAVMPLAMMDDATTERLINVNLRGVVNGMAVAAPIMQAAGRGAIVNTASVAGLYGSPLFGVYSGTKGAVVAMTRSAAMEFAPTLRVNAIAPGGVRTRFNEAMFGTALPDEIEEKLGTVHPLGRNAQPEEIAAGVAFLASDDASFITGHVLVIDGGISAGAVLDLSVLGGA